MKFALYAELAEEEPAWAQKFVLHEHGPEEGMQPTRMTTDFKIKNEIPNDVFLELPVNPNKLFRPEEQEIES